MLVLFFSFVLSEVLDDVVKINQRMNYADAIFLVYKERHASSTDCTTNHASSSY